MISRQTITLVFYPPAHQQFRSHNQSTQIAYHIFVLPSRTYQQIQCNASVTTALFYTGGLLGLPIDVGFWDSPPFFFYFSLFFIHDIVYCFFTKRTKNLKPRPHPAPPPPPPLRLTFPLFSILNGARFLFLNNRILKRRDQKPMDHQKEECK